MTVAADPELGNVDWLDNWTLGPGVRFELFELATKSVWLCQTPIDPADLDSLDLPDGWVLAPVGEAGADAAFFRRSPGAAADGPVEVCEVAGHRMVRVAVPVGQEELAPGVQMLSIEKHHTVRIAAGRTIDVLDAPDGTVQIQAWMAPGDLTTPLPDGWSCRAVTLTRDLIAELPNPARLVVVDGSGFHGPVSAADIDEATA